MNLGMTFKGLEALDKSLKIMDKSDDKLLTASTRSGARVILKATKDECPSSEDGNYNHAKGNLKKSEKMKMLKPKKKGVRVALIGETVGKKAKHDGWYGRLVEKGTSKTQPNGYKRRAFDENIDQAKAAMAKTYQEGLKAKTVSDFNKIASMLVDKIGEDEVE